MIQTRACRYTPAYYTRELCLNSRCQARCEHCVLPMRTLLRMTPETAGSAAGEAFERAEGFEGVRLVLFGGDVLRETECLQAIREACGRHENKRVRIEAEICLPQLNEERLEYLSSLRPDVTPIVKLRKSWLEEAAPELLDALAPMARFVYCLLPGETAGLCDTLLALDRKKLSVMAIAASDWKEWTKESLNSLRQELIKLPLVADRLSPTLSESLFPETDIQLAYLQEDCLEGSCPAFRRQDCIHSDGERYGCRALSPFAKPPTVAWRCGKDDGPRCAGAEECAWRSVCQRCADTGDADGQPLHCLATRQQLMAAVLYHMKRPDSTLSKRKLLDVAQGLKGGKQHGKQT